MVWWALAGGELAVILNLALLATTALFFVVIFGGLTAFYIGGTEAVPKWFRRLGLLPPAQISPRRRTIGLATALAFIGLAEWAVAANLDPNAPLSSGVLVVEQIGAIFWLLYLARRLLRLRSPI